MQYTNLGRSGLKVSRICLGTMSYGSSKWQSWVLDEHDARPLIRRALELGINFFDTADSYSRGVSEEVIGRALKDMAKRDEVVIATKVFNQMSDRPNDRGLSRKHVFASLDASLKRLGVDYVDLYQTHRCDPETPVEETLQALADVVRAGKVRYVGASNIQAWRLVKALHLSEQNNWPPFISVQNAYSLAQREEEREMMPYCRQRGVGVIPYSPLGRGTLTGGRRRALPPPTERGRSDRLIGQYYDDEQCYAISDRVADVAKARGIAPAQVALAWLLRQPALTAPIVGATRMEHLGQAVGALDVMLTDEECRRLEELYRPRQPIY